MNINFDSDSIAIANKKDEHDNNKGGHCRSSEMVVPVLEAEMMLLSNMAAMIYVMAAM